MDNQQNHVLITGGGSGIGLATARTFVNAGYRVTLAGRNRNRLDAAISHLPGASALPLDVTDEAALTIAFQNLASEAICPIYLLIMQAPPKPRPCTAPALMTGTPCWL